MTTPAVRFEKLQEIDLSLEDPVSDALSLANGDSDHDFGRVELQDGGVVHLNLDGEMQDPVFIPKWKFWKQPSRYRYDLTTAKNFLSRKQVCKWCKINSWKAVVITLLVFIIAVIISVIISRFVREPPDDSPIQPPHAPPFQGAVAVDAPVCSEMSADILRRNGSAVDAAITAILCSGVVHAESSGLGGGGFMTVHHSNGSVYIINFREEAPNAATENMFHSNSSLSKAGGLSVAVPGELRGIELAHRLFGRLPWSELFTPVINLCKNGFKMTHHAENAVNTTWKYLSNDARFRKIYSNENGTLKKEDDLVFRPVLATTLKSIAENGADALYSGSIAESIVRAVNSSEVKGILTMEDLASYQALLQEPLHTHYNGHTIYAPPSPAGGPLFLFIMNVLGAYNISAIDHAQEVSQLNLTYHRLVEIFKYGFALRTRLGDPRCPQCSNNTEEILGLQYNMTTEAFGAQVRASISDEHTFNVSHYHAQYSDTQDSGTTHLSVLAPDGQAVSVTTSVNTYFGSKLITDTGIVLNNDMDDFSSPDIINSFGFRPSPANFISPRKRPLSSTSPAIFISESTGQSLPSLVIGASGGSRIPTAMAQAVLRYLSLSESLEDAIEARRVHHQLVPDEVCTESGFPDTITKFLANRGHNITCINPEDYAAVQGVGVSLQGNITAHADSRKQGHTSVTD